MDRVAELSDGDVVHVHSWYVPPIVVYDPCSNIAVTAIVAMRVYALHNNCIWVRRSLCIAGIAYCLASVTIVTLGTVYVIREYCSAVQAFSYSDLHQRACAHTKVHAWAMYVTVTYHLI